MKDMVQNYENELYHYGVLGMKWGKRKRQAKADYKNAKNKAFSRYERDIESLEKGYKRGQLLSKKDQAKEAKIESRYNNTVAKAKSDYKKEKQNIASERKQFKQDVKTMTKLAKTPDVTIYNKNGLEVGKLNARRAFDNTLQSKKGKAYAESVIEASNSKIRRQNIATVATSTAFIVGSAYLSSMR